MTAISPNTTHGMPPDDFRGGDATWPYGCAP